MPTIAASPAVAFKHILVTTDFSDASKRAIAYAASLARHYDSHLYLAHVLNPSLFYMAAAQEAGGAIALEQAKLELKQKLQEMAVEMIQHDGIAAGALLGEGDIGENVQHMIEEQKIDLVVAGTHGGDNLHRLVMGSTADRILREAACPVLTVGPHVTSHPDTETRLQHILYATDLTPEATTVLPHALSLANEYHARLTLLHVMSPHHVSILEIERKASHYRVELRNLIPHSEDCWTQPTLLALYGSPAETITRYAAENGVDLIVIGAKKGFALQAHLIGGTAYKVICETQCPVLTVRHA